MRTVLLAVVLGGGILPAAARADPVTVLPAGALWNYTFMDPTADPAWNTTGGGGGTWLSGHAPFGNCPAAGCGGFTTDFDAATFWPADNSGSLDDNLWVRTSVDLPGGLQSLQWNLGADNGFKLFVNGVLVASDNAEGYTSRWEYSGSIPQNLVGSGAQVIALALEDHGGLTAFDMEIVGAATPEPASAVLCIIGLVGAGMRKLWM